ncbi:hypothetical protein PTQ19_07265 [Microbacterium esteraromaticum]|uniref:hypothetical protein n=1 Tax=Microbacterium esteraromaticum TaxID=57043 RepID=UPI00236817D2|nr:hypothetical protein [Microbacterium esteraromaticum]WDH80222.1 hypothetical protein PTQ19_07265 [Microbacterium esteraromaticum]
MTIATSTEPFDFSGGRDYPGDRGVRLSTTRPGAPGYAFSVDFPDVFISENNEVGVGGHRFPADDMLAWMDAIREHLTHQR